MNNLEPRIEAIRQEYGLEASDFWKIKQNGQWVCKHAALEVIAVKAKVEWLPPQIIEANATALVTSMIVTGRMGERTEWSTGETNPTNYSVVGKQPAYPWAMSEKRAKDRVVLKLVGIHGLVYSEAEGDFAEPPQQNTPSQTPAEPQQAPKAKTVSQLKAAYEKLKGELVTEQGKGWRNLGSWLRDPSVLADIESLERYADDFKKEARGIFDLAKAAEQVLGEEVHVGSSYVPPDFSGMQDEIPYRDELQQALEAQK